MRDDIRYAIRQLLKNPGFALVAVATLALGIGAASAMFGLIQGVLLSPPPYADPGRLVLMTPERTDGRPYDDRPTMAQILAWSQARTFEAPALYGWTFDFLVEADGSESMGGMLVTPELLPDARRETDDRPRAHRRGVRDAARYRRPPSSSATTSGAGNSTATRTSSASRSS